MFSVVNQNSAPLNHNEAEIAGYRDALNEIHLGYDAGKYVSFEEQINQYKAWYYDALQQSSENWESNDNTYVPFIEHFLTPVSKAEICKILPDVSPTTVEAVLGEMVKNGSIRRIGQGRSSKYIKA